MSKELKVIEPPQTGLMEWTEERVDLLKRTICKGATNDELQLFLAICKRTQLDPFTKQIYAVKRWDSKEKREVMQSQTSVDGLRLIAERTGKYDGQDGPYWCGSDGKWVDVWLSDQPPAAAKVTVFKTGSSRGFTGTVTWREFAQHTKDGKLTSMWAGKSSVMLAKCAESVALRKGFPNEMSGLYTKEEMPAADSDALTALAPQPGFAPAPKVVPASDSDTFPWENQAPQSIASLIPTVMASSLAEQTVGSGKHADVKFKDKPREFWLEYIWQVNGVMADLADDDKTRAEALIKRIETYLAEK
jgi:phage recombination protein Bet